MMLTGGIEAADGKSYRLDTGVPGPDGGGRLATGGGASLGGGFELATGGCLSTTGALLFQTTAWRATYSL
jgi:hypothetical protein